jgi:hypothetical protein
MELCQTQKEVGDAQACLDAQLEAVFKFND